LPVGITAGHDRHLSRRVEGAFRDQRAARRALAREHIPARAEADSRYRVSDPKRGAEMTVPSRSRSRWLLCAGMLALAFVPLPTGAASASCAAPYLAVGHRQEHPHVRPGAGLTVVGRAFVRGCDDTGAVSEGSFGCHSTEHRTPSTPMRDVVLLLRQGDRAWRLGTEDAGSAADNTLGRVTWRVRVPAGVAAGRAVLVADVSPRGPDPLDARLPVVVRRR
jgi:hypothetical protein